MISGPIGDRVRLRLAGNFLDANEGWIENLQPGEGDLMRGEKSNMRLTVDVDVTESLDASLLFGRSTAEGPWDHWAVIHQHFDLGVASGLPSVDPRDTPPSDVLLTEEPRRVYNRHNDLGPSDSDREYQLMGLTMSISWYGKTGPYAEFVGSDAQCFALNGMLRSIGHSQGPPVIPTGYQAQIVGGLTAFVAAMAQVLCHELNPSQPPLVMHTSIFESMMCFTEVGVITAYNTELEVGRMGINRFPPTYPMGVFPCKDGWIGITVLTPSQWSTFCQLLELKEFEGIDLFQSAIGRFEALDILEPVICERLLSLSCEELFYKAQRAALPLARVPTMDELFDVDQFADRQAFANLELGSGRRLKAPTVPFRLFATPPKLGGEVAPLGADTKAYDI